MNFTSPLLCLDLGNTTCRGGIWLEGKIQDENTISTQEFSLSAKKWIERWKIYEKVCYCSVVPTAEQSLKAALAALNMQNTYCLNAGTLSHLPIAYPKPSEIGADRIANSYAVYKKYPLPAVVIDLGTATTFDVVTKTSGYIGGVIVPGPQGMLDYLGNRTAMLPQIDLTNQNRTVSAIGQSTGLAMMSGLCHGYLPMLHGILHSINLELEKNGEKILSIVQTGGEAKNFLLERALIHNSLTLEGLAFACLDQQDRS